MQEFRYMYTYLYQKTKGLIANKVFSLCLALALSRVGCATLNERQSGVIL